MVASGGGGTEGSTYGAIVHEAVQCRPEPGKGLDAGGRDGEGQAQAPQACVATQQLAAGVAEHEALLLVERGQVWEAPQQRVDFRFRQPRRGVELSQGLIHESLPPA
jgi:hypothetical protein